MPSPQPVESPTRAAWDEDGVARLYFNATRQNKFLLPQVDEQAAMLRNIHRRLHVDRAAVAAAERAAGAHVDAAAPPHENDRPSVLIDVGCGGGLLLRLAATALPESTHLIGVDLDASSLQIAEGNVHDAGALHRATLIRGDATKLRALLAASPQASSVLGDAARPRIIASCGNTIGILPPEVRVAVIAEMMVLARPDVDRLAFHFFHAAHMRRGMREYYEVHPELTGRRVEPRDFDFEHGTLHVAESGYRSQWYTEASAAELFQQALELARSHGADIDVTFKYYEKAGGLFAIGNVRRTRDTPREE